VRLQHLKSVTLYFRQYDEGLRARIEAIKTDELVLQIQIWQNVKKFPAKAKVLLWDNFRNPITFTDSSAFRQILPAINQSYEKDPKNLITVENLDATTDVNGAILSGCLFLNCSFIGVDFSKSTWREVIFVGCDLTSAKFGGSTINVKFTNCNLTGVKFSGTLKCQLS